MEENGFMLDVSSQPTYASVFNDDYSSEIRILPQSDGVVVQIIFHLELEQSMHGKGIRKELVFRFPAGGSYSPEKVYMEVEGIECCKNIILTNRLKQLMESNKECFINVDNKKTLKYPLNEFSSCLNELV